MRGAALLAVGLAWTSAAAAGEPPPERELAVLAAASLRDAFTDLAAAFERAHPGVTVALSFAGSQQLRAQVEHGAVADVFASADGRTVKALQEAGHCQAPVVFARNALVVVVPAANPAGIESFEDLPKARRLVAGVPESPVGAYTVKALERAEKARPGFRARVEARIASRELNVRQVLAKVRLGEAEAGIAYRTDAASAAGAVGVVPIPDAFNDPAEYPVAILTRAPQPELARKFVAMLTGAEGRRALVARGFVAGRP